METPGTIKKADKPIVRKSTVPAIEVAQKSKSKNAPKSPRKTLQTAPIPTKTEPKKRPIPTEDLIVPPHSKRQRPVYNLGMLDNPLMGNFIRTTSQQFDDNKDASSSEDEEMPQPDIPRAEKLSENFAEAIHYQYSDDFSSGRDADDHDMEDLQVEIPNIVKCAY